MKAKTYAFSWKVGNGITGPDFLRHLQSTNGKEKDRHILAIGTNGAFWGGVFLTIRDMKAFCKMRKAGGVLSVQPETLPPDERLVEFNFFILNPKTLVGLYQYYHLSSTTLAFCRFCHERYADLRQEKIREIMRAKGWPETDARKKTAAARTLTGALKYQVYIRPEAFGDCINNLQRLKSFTFTPMSPQANDPLLVPTITAAKSVTHAVSFRRDQTLWRTGVECALGILKSNPRKATAVGVDIHGHDAVFKLEKDYQYLNEADYDGVAAEVNLAALDGRVATTTPVQSLVQLAGNAGVRVILNTPME